MRLRVFGGLSIESATGEVLEGAAARRRPLALLAIIATHGKRGVSRERLCALLWPESDGGHARNVLNQTVSSLRRELRQPALFLGKADLRLNPAAIGSDVEDFWTGLESNELDRAVDAYAGPFLDGVHLRGSSEFERWVEWERARLQSRASEALRTLARHAVDRADHETAVQWWRRIAAIDPGDPRAACGLMAGLEALGDRAGALRYARLHASYLRQELDVDPDPAVAGLAERLRASPYRGRGPGPPRDMPNDDAQAAPGPGRSIGGDTPSLVTEEAVGNPVVTPMPGAAMPAIGEERQKGAGDRIAGGPRRASSLNRRHAVSAAGITLVALSVVVGAAWLTVPSTEGRSVGEVDPNSVVVFPFTVRGDGDASYLTEALPYLLSANLDGAGEIHALDPRVVLARALQRADSLDAVQGAVMARQLGAGRFVLGTVVQSGERIRIGVSLHDQGEPDGTLGRMMVEGRVQDLFVLADLASERLLALYPAGPQPRFSRAAGSTTSSLAAFKAYLGAESSFRRGDFRGAIESFERAVEADSTFALARYRLSVAADWGARYDLAHAAAERAARDSLRLTPYYRLLLGSLRAQRNSEADEAERLVRRALTIQREDSEAWYQLAEILFHMNAMRGRSLREAITPFEEVLARSPDHFESLVHLARLAAYDGDRERLRKLLPKVLRLAPAQVAFETELLAAALLGDRREQDRLLARAARLGDVDLHNQCARVAIYGRGRGDVERLCALLVEPTRSIEGRALGYWGLAELAMWRGQRQRARVYVAELKALVPEWGVALEALYAAYPPLTATPAELRTLGQRLGDQRTEPSSRNLRYFGVMDGRHPMLRAYLRGHLRLHAGDTANVGATLEELTAASTATPPSGLLARNFAAALRAQQFAQLGHADSALRQLEQQGGEYMVGERWIGELHTSRFLRAEVLASLGREREALGWYDTFGQVSIWELGLEAPAAIVSARIEDRLGRRAAAAAHYRRVVELWEGADAELQPVVAEARRRLKAVGM